VGGVEAHRKLMLSANVRRPGTKYKRSKIAFAVTSVAFTGVHICTELLQLPAQSLIGSTGTLSAIVRVLQCVAVCCSVLQCVAVCCSVLQCVAVCSVCCSALQYDAVQSTIKEGARSFVHCSVLQCVAASCCSVLYCVVVCYRVLQCVALRRPIK